ncbi:hypothetical protein [Methylogaea oryzae]|uniref:hypothetical protein n=1 Tax=Methylogaea oryzae TaxID=1295382 RepID=UPI00402BEC6C
MLAKRRQAVVHPHLGPFPVIQARAAQLGVLELEASGRIKCSRQPVLAHRRMMLPVLGGISGW